MACWALIPVKAPAHCKSRLAGVLDARRRSELVEVMLARAIAAACAARAIDRVLVVSPGGRPLPAGVAHVRDGGAGLVPALDLARAAARAAGAERLLVLAADLPHISAAAIDRAAVRSAPAEVAVAVDRAGTGTNGLWLPAAEPFTFRFGAGSARQHALEATTRGYSVTTVSDPAFAFDVDTPEDLRTLGGTVDRGRRGVVPRAAGSRA